MGPAYSAGPYVIAVIDFRTQSLEALHTPGPLDKHGLSNTGATGRTPYRTTPAAYIQHPEKPGDTLLQSTVSTTNSADGTGTDPSTISDKHRDPLRLTGTFTASFRRQCAANLNHRMPENLPQRRIWSNCCPPDNRTSEQPLKTPFSVRMPGDLARRARHSPEFQIPMSPTHQLHPGTNRNGCLWRWLFVQLPDCIFRKLYHVIVPGISILTRFTTLPVPGTHLLTGPSNMVDRPSQDCRPTSQSLPSDLPPVERHKTSHLPLTKPHFRGTRCTHLFLPVFCIFIVPIIRFLSRKNTHHLHFFFAARFRRPVFTITSKCSTTYIFKFFFPAAISQAPAKKIYHFPYERHPATNFSPQKKRAHSHPNNRPPHFRRIRNHPWETLCKRSPILPGKPDVLKWEQQVCAVGICGQPISLF